MAQCCDFISEVLGIIGATMRETPVMKCNEFDVVRMTDPPSASATPSRHLPSTLLGFLDYHLWRPALGW
jgi:hypothetical protein